VPEYRAARAGKQGPCPLAGGLRNRHGHAPSSASVAGEHLKDKSPGEIAINPTRARFGTAITGPPMRREEPALSIDPHGKAGQAPALLSGRRFNRGAGRFIIPARTFCR
jgi:hypothetical protein